MRIVDFVGQHKDVFVAAGFPINVLFEIKKCIMVCGGSVEYEEYDGGAACLLNRSANANALNRVACVAYASCVDEVETHTVDGDVLFNGVARGAGNVGNDGAFFIEQRVE